MSEVIEQCKRWVEQVVIGHNFCPFAEQEFVKGRVRFVLSEATAFEDGLHALIKECERLDDCSDVETTLIVFSELLMDFDDFLDFVDMSNELMKMQGYEGVFQLANFHPDYCFEGEEKNDAANYTNRSPYPMLHLIRELSLEKAVKNHPSPDLIPENNVNLAREKGCQYFEDILHDIKKDKVNVL